MDTQIVDYTVRVEWPSWFVIDCFTNEPIMNALARVIIFMGGKVVNEGIKPIRIHH